jgi:hypothetical protein
MGDLCSSLLIFTIIKTILSTFFLTVSKFYKNLVKWAFTEMLCSVAGTTTLDNDYVVIIRLSYDFILVYSNINKDEHKSPISNQFSLKNDPPPHFLENYFAEVKIKKLKTITLNIQTMISLLYCHSLFRVVVPATLLSISVNAHFTRLFFLI